MGRVLRVSRLRVLHACVHAVEEGVFRLLNGEARPASHSSLRRLTALINRLAGEFVVALDIQRPVLTQFHLPARRVRPLGRRLLKRLFFLRHIALRAYHFQLRLLRLALARRLCLRRRRLILLHFLLGLRCRLSRKALFLLARSRLSLLLRLTALALCALVLALLRQLRLEFERLFLTALAQGIAFLAFFADGDTHIVDHL